MSSIYNIPPNYIGDYTKDSIAAVQNPWSAATDDSTFSSALSSVGENITKRLDKAELTITLLKLKILQLEGRFTQEEVSNIKKMIMSDDKASRTLAETIIENT
jgi:hypothetical protein